MKVRFWGTRGSIAKAGPSTVRYGGNTSCVEVRSASGTLVVLDCGTGAHGLGQSLIQDGEPCSGHILVSHTHWDHIQGIPFFAPLFGAGNEWHIYGPRGLGQSLRDVLAGQMEYTYFPVALDQFAASIHYHDVGEGVFTVGDIRVEARYLNHPALTMGYRLEADGAVVVYATDHEPYAQDVALGTAGASRSEDEAHQHFVQGADLLIHDAQYTAAEYGDKIGWGHSTVEFATDLAMAAGVKHVVLYHHDPMRSDDEVDGLLDVARRRVADAAGSIEVSAATEGVAIELEGKPHEVPRAGDETRPAGLLDAVEDLSNKQVLIAVAGEAERAILAAGARADKVGVIEVGDARDLRAAFERRWPSLVFVGDDLPHADPLVLCREIRGLAHADAKSTPVIVVTDEDRVDAKAGRAAGVTDWLSRPFSQQYARTRTRAWLLRTSCCWVRAPLPTDEESRIAALHGLGILDTEAEERFDRHTRVAAAAFDAPVALVSLVDRERQWFKSSHGLESRETPRDMAFCAHAIHGDDAFVVTDALQDERFADNPLVTHDPRIRFYAGVPLRVADGSRVGTLCVIDHRPRELSATQLELLKEIGKLVEREFEPQG